MAKSVIRKGKAALPSSTGGEGRIYFSLKDGDSALAIPLVGIDDLISIEQHVFWLDGGNSPTFPCIGPGCPGCELGNTARFRAFLPILTKENGPKIFGFGIKVARQFSEIAAETDIKGHVCKVRRTGSGLSTQYTVVPTGAHKDISAVEIPDVEKELGPTDREGILKMLTDAGVISEGDLDRKAEGGDKTSSDWESL